MACILVVDDDAALCFALCRLLEQQGYEVVTATDGYEGLQRLAARRPDVLLTDIFLPEMDGIEMIRRVRRRCRRLPIIAMSVGSRVYSVGEVLEVARDF